MRSNAYLACTDLERSWCSPAGSFGSMPYKQAPDVLSGNRTRMTRIQRIFADPIRADPPYPRHPRSIAALRAHRGCLSTQTAVMLMGHVGGALKKNAWSYNASGAGE